MARYIAGDSGVGVGEPCATELGRALEHRHIGESMAPQFDCRGDATEPGPDDYDLERSICSHSRTLPLPG